LAHRREFARDLEKNDRLYYSWKNSIRDTIDLPMLKRVFPFGRQLYHVYAEIYEGHGTFGRQAGTYPILCYVGKRLEIGQTYHLIVIDHGFRSLTCLEYPVRLLKLSFKELESIPGIGKKRAGNIMAKSPRTKIEWLKIVDENLFHQLSQLDPSILHLSE